MKNFTFLFAILSTQAAVAHTDTILTASLDYTTVKSGTEQAPPSPATGSATFILSVPDAGESGLPTVSYSIELNNLDLDGNQTVDSADNVTAIHLHDITAGILANSGSKAGVSTGGTQHALNIFGFPGNGDPMNNPAGGDDDNDIAVTPAAGLVTGLWEDSDAVVRAGLGSTLPVSHEFSPTDTLMDRLLAGNLYLMVHTAGGTLPGGITIGGYLNTVPEPSSIALALLSAGTIVMRRRRS